LLMIEENGVVKKDKLLTITLVIYVVWFTISIIAWILNGFRLSF
jgi:ammonia channel protein AmtB